MSLYGRIQLSSNQTQQVRDITHEQMHSQFLIRNYELTRNEAKQKSFQVLSGEHELLVGNRWNDGPRSTLFMTRNGFISLRARDRQSLLCVWTLQPSTSKSVIVTELSHKETVESSRKRCFFPEYELECPMIHEGFAHIQAGSHSN